MFHISPTLKCQEIVKKRKEMGLEVYNLGLGANPLKQPQKYIDLIKKYADKKDYVSSSGIIELQNVLIEKYSGINYKVNNILVGNGSKELIFILQLVFQGKIFHITPSWVSYKEQINILEKNNNLIEINTNINNNFKLNLEDLDNMLNKYKKDDKMLIFNNPCNPTGLHYSTNELEKLSNIIKKHNVILLADEIYNNLIFDEKVLSISEYLPKSTIRCSSVSKDLGCGGYRLGWVTFPKELDYFFNKCKSVASSIYSCSNLPVQYATAEILQMKNEFNIHCNNTKLIFKEIVNECCKLLDNSKIKYIKPTSAWYIFLDFSYYEKKLKELNIKNSYELSYYLIDKLGIVNVAGEAFNCKGLNIRLSLVDFKLINGKVNYDNIILALKKILSFL